MPAPTAPEWIFDTGSPTLDGLLSSFQSNEQKAANLFVRNDGNERRFRLVTRAGDDENRPWADVDLSAAVVEFAIGAVDSSPTAGTFAGSSNGNTTGLTAIAYNVSAAALQTALNLNPDVTAGAATVTVTQYGTAYVITWSLVGVRSLIAWDGALLTPECTCTGSRIQTGTASVKEIQLLRVVQRPYAYVAPTTSYPIAASTVTQIQTGTASLPSIQRIALSPAPYDGSFVVSAGKPQISRVIAKGHTGSTYEVSTVQTIADVAGALHDKVAALLYDTAGPVQILLTNGGAILTALPSGGRRITVTFVNADSANTIATALKNAVDADAQFGATVSTSLVTITDAAFGTRTEIAIGSSAFAVSRVTAGAFGNLHTTYFTLRDAADATCGVYLTQTGAIPATGHDVLSLGRYISVTIAATDTTATLIGALINTAVDADADFISTHSTGTLTITASANGARTTPSAGTSTFGVSQTSSGVSVSATIASDSGATEFTTAMGAQFTVQKTGTHQWDISFVENGAQSAISPTLTGLSVPTGLIGELNLNTVQTQAAFAATSEETIDAILEGSITFPGKRPITFYHQTVTLYRDLIDFSTLVSANAGAGSLFGGFAQWYPTITGYIGGGPANLDGVPTVALITPQLTLFKHSVDGGRAYVLRAGTDAEASPGIIRPDDYNGATNAKVWESFL